MPSSPTLAICTTTLPPGSSLNTWIDYHLQRVDRIFLFIDGTMEAGTKNISSRKEMLVFANGDPGIEEVRMPNDTMAMLMKNGDAAVELCRKESIDWLFHIDSDELIWSQKDELKSYFGQLESDVSHVSFINHEAAQRFEDLKNCFTEMQIFKRNSTEHLLPEGDPRRGRFFHAYTHGKSAVRVENCVRTNGVHEFLTDKGRSIKENNSPCILHYPNPCYRDWLKKWKRNGNFSNFWWDNLETPIDLSFWIESRDVYLRAVSSGNWKIAEDYFRSNIFSDEELEMLIAQGACFRARVID